MIRTYSPEDHLGRSRSPIEESRAYAEARANMPIDVKMFQLGLYSTDNPFSRHNTEKLRQDQKEWQLKTGLIMKAEKDKKAIVDYQRKLKIGQAGGLQPTGSKASMLGGKEAQMRKMWALQDAADESQSALEGYWARREGMKKLRGGRKGRFYPDKEMRARKRDPFAEIRRLEGSRFGRTPGLAPRGMEAKPSYKGTYRWSVK